MSLDINNLKESIIKLNPNSKIIVKLQISGTKEYVECGILRISKPPTGLELIIEKNKTSQVSITDFQDSLETCNENDNIGYILREPDFQIQRGSNITNFLIQNNDLYLISLLFPRPV